MAQDIKDLFKKEQLHIQNTLSDGHEARFLERLDAALPQEKSTETKRQFSFYQIAAAVIVLISLGAFLYQQLTNGSSIIGNDNEVVTSDTKENTVKSSLTSLGDISPDLKKIENYYVANINYELTQVETSGIGKQLFESYMKKLSLLNEEHKVLQQELTDIGPNEQTINAMIDNLQFRLKLLYQLKEKLNELKKSENDVL
jgi:vacuolar-type H+-ATPase subunit I/STV1